METASAVSLPLSIELTILVAKRPALEMASIGRVVVFEHMFEKKNRTTTAEFPHMIQRKMNDKTKEATTLNYVYTHTGTRRKGIFAPPTDEESQHFLIAFDRFSLCSVETVGRLRNKMNVKLQIRETLRYNDRGVPGDSEE
eukprot:UC4_evm5s607